MSRRWRKDWEELEEGFGKMETGLKEIKRPKKRISKGRIRSSTRRAKRTAKRITKRHPKAPKLVERKLRAPSIVHVSQPMSHRGAFEEGTEREQESEAIRAMRYFGDEGKLWIWFQSGGKYTYYGVPGNVFMNFRNAPSKGRYFIKNIRNTKKYGNHYKYAEGLN